MQNTSVLVKDAKTYVDRIGRVTTFKILTVVTGLGGLLILLELFVKSGGEIALVGLTFGFWGGVFALLSLQSRI